MGDRDLQSRLLRAAVVVHAGDDRADGPLRASSGCLGGGTGRVRRCNRRAADEPRGRPPARHRIHLRCRLQYRWFIARDRVRRDPHRDPTDPCDRWTVTGIPHGIWKTHEDVSIEVSAHLSRTKSYGAVLTRVSPARGREESRSRNTRRSRATEAMRASMGLSRVTSKLSIPDQYMTYRWLFRTLGHCTSTMS